MRALIAASTFPPDIGGPASYVPAIAASLVERGLRVHVVYLGDREDGVRDPQPFAVTRVGRRRPRATRMAAMVRALVAHGRGADVLYANGLGLEARCAGHLLGIPVVHKVVGDLGWERARNRGWYRGTLDAYQTASKGPRLRLLDAWRRASLRGAAAVITPSAYLADIVAGWGVPPARIHVVYNALPAQPPTPVPVPLPDFAGATLLTVCRLVPWKGVDGVIDAVANLERVRLVAVGDGPCRRRLEAHAHARGAGARVLWIGARTPGEVEALFRVADAFVLNSSYEGLPHVVLEAMRAGVPVVATNVGGTPEVISDGVTGRLVRHGDATSLRHALSATIRCPADAKAMADRARAQLGARFDYTALVDQTAAILTNAVERRRTADA